MGISVFPVKTSGAMPQLQRVVTSTQAIDMGTIRNCYVILAGGGGGGAGGTTPGASVYSGSGGGGGGAIAGPILFQQAYVTIGSGGAGAGPAGGGNSVGGDGGHSYLTKIGYANANSTTGRRASYISASGGRGGVNSTGAGSAPFGPNPGSPSISNVNTYVYMIGNTGGTAEGTGAGGYTGANSGYGYDSYNYNMVKNWISNELIWFTSGSSGTISGESPTDRATFWGGISTPTSFDWNGSNQTYLWSSGTLAASRIPPYSGGGPMNNTSTAKNGGGGPFTGGGGGGAYGSSATGVGGANYFFQSPNRSTGESSAGGGGGGGAGVLTAGAVGGNSSGNTISGNGGAGGLGGGGGGGGGTGNGSTTAGTGGNGGAGAFLIFY
jgi:hypothetical protein